MLRFFSFARNWLYDQGWLKVHRIPHVRVVSVGNIAMGGTGKTPLILELLKAFEGMPVALLTRGYGGAYQKSDLPLVVEEDASASFVGDEPLLIKRAFPKTLVVVDPDRVRGGHFSAAKGARLLLLDDGMQHRRLARDVEIVVIDGENPFPRWRLREPESALKRADLIVVMGGTFVPSQPFVRMKKQLIGAFAVSSGQEIEIKGKKVGLFCGVGKPLQVQKTAEEGGAEVVQTLFLRDHQMPSLEKLRDFAALCENSGASVLLCTEKDRIKLPPSLPIALQMAFLKIRLEVVEGEELWLNHIKQEME